MQKRVTFSIWYFIVAMIFLMGIQSLFYHPVPEISYRTFRQYLADGKLKQISIGQENIRGAYLEEGGEKAFHLRRVEDPKLIEDLEKSSVDYRGVDETNWLTGLLTGWILPFGFLALIWVFMFRRMGSGQMTFGKAKVKIYDEQTQNNVTFKDVAGIDEVERELEEIISFLKDPRHF